MSQQTALVQTTSAGSDMTPVLGSIQSIGPNTQASSTVPNIQSGNTVVQILQPQTQSQQTQFVTQPPKQQVAQQPSTQQQQQQSSFNDFPQVRDLLHLKTIVYCIIVNFFDL